MLSKKSQYAFKALVYLGEKYKDGPVLIAEIAKKKKIPVKFLEAILLELKRARIVSSKKGKGGGYYLHIPPEKIKVSTVIRLVNGPIAMLPCVSLYFYEHCKDCDEKHCGLHDLMVQVRDSTLSIVENRTIKDLMV